NHRMHNKLFIADSAVAVAGGRNLADEYFFRSSEANFIDFDLAIVGAIVPQLSSCFDMYWNSEFVYPVQAITSNGLGDEDRRASFERLTQPGASSRNALPRAAEKDMLGLPTLGTELDTRSYHFIAAESRAFADPPSKINTEPGKLPDTLHRRFVEQV